MDGEFYSLNGRKIDKQNPPLIKKDKKATDNLIDGLNALLAQITNDAVQKKVEKNVEEYLNSKNLKQKIIDYILKELDIKTQKQILEMIKKIIGDFSIEDNIRKSLRDLFN